VAFSAAPASESATGISMGTTSSRGVDAPLCRRQCLRSTYAVA
jgi:hypothetical protein